MSEPRIAETAQADMDEIWAYVAARSPDAADRIIEAIVERAQLYTRTPNLEILRGTSCPEPAVSGSGIM